MIKFMLNDLDRRILRHLQLDPGRSVAALAEAANTTSAVCARRLARMKQNGVVLGQEAVIDWRVLGYAVEVSLRVSLDKTQTRAFDDFITAARLVPEVIEIQTFLGRVDVRHAHLRHSFWVGHMVHIALADPRLEDVDGCGATPLPGASTTQPRAPAATSGDRSSRTPSTTPPTGPISLRLQRPLRTGGWAVRPLYSSKPTRRSQEPGERNRRGTSPSTDGKDETAS